VISYNYGGFGGGAAYSDLGGCILFSNSAGSGGGAYSCNLANCTLTANAASYGGGDTSGTLENCIVYYNIATVNYTNYYGGTFMSCCTTPQLPEAGNITNAPLFVNPANGDFRLQLNSPCINSGNNAYVPGPTDIDGNPRVQGGSVDMGAYEYQTPNSILSYAWAQQYGLHTDGSADNADSDGDGMKNWQEWKSGTNPTNALSLLKMNSVSNGITSTTVTWQSVTNATYYLQRSSNLSAQPAFSSIQSNIAGQVNTTSYTDTNAVGWGPFFYRVGVQ
jgi:hypothetical protein